MAHFLKFHQHISTRAASRIHWQTSFSLLRKCIHHNWHKLLYMSTVHCPDYTHTWLTNCWLRTAPFLIALHSRRHQTLQLITKWDSVVNSSSCLGISIMLPWLTTKDSDQFEQCAIWMCYVLCLWKKPELWWCPQQCYPLGTSSAG
jgi:hypothetical protein